MTLVVTHTEGFLGCFTVEPDGSLRQRALIDTGSEPHTPLELAELGTILADQWGWSLNGHAPAPVKKALPAQKRGYQRFQRPPMDERAPILLNYLAKHPGSTIRELVESRGEVWSGTTNVFWFQELEKLVVAGQVIKVTGPAPSGGKVNVYSLAQK